MTTLLFLPPDDAAAWRWWRVDGAAIHEGEGVPDADGGEVIALAPADAVTLHWADIPARSPAQAAAAARIVVAEATAGGGGDLHVAVGRAEDGGERAIAVVASERMAAWLHALARVGIDPAAIVPVPLLLPVPDEGYVRAELGAQAVVRGAAAAFADEPALTGLVTGNAAPRSVAAEVLHARAAALTAAVPLDLRQGPFARRRRRAIDWPLVRRLAVLTGLVLLVTLAIDVVRGARYALGADALEAQAETVARQGLARDAGAGDAARMLADRLSRLNGPGLGFSRTAAVVYDVVQQVPDSEVTALNFDPDGALRVTLAAPGEGQVNGIKARLERAGFAVAASTFTAANGRISGDLTVRP